MADFSASVAGVVGELEEASASIPGYMGPMGYMAGAEGGSAVWGTETVERTKKNTTRRFNPPPLSHREGGFEPLAWQLKEGGGREHTNELRANFVSQFGE